MKSKSKVGQITVRKIGKRWVLCISGDPKKIFSSFENAKSKADSLRKNYGRRPSRNKK